MTYSKDFRQKALEIREQEGLTIEETAIRFGVGGASIMRWLKRVEPQETRNKSATKLNMDALKRELEENPAVYQYELAKQFGVCQAAIGKALQRLKISYKNSDSPLLSRSDCRIQKWTKTHGIFFRTR